MTRTANDPPAVDPYRYRVETAVAELQQAVEFQNGDRDWVFGVADSIPLDSLKLRRFGAAMACVSVALNCLKQRYPFSTVQPTLADLRWMHTYKACGEQCPFCVNGERDQ